MTDQKAIESGSAPIIFFDGVCGLCNKVVDIVLNADREKHFRFSPLQGNTANARLSRNIDLRGELRSIVLWEDGEIYQKSDAILRIFQGLGGVWGILAIIGKAIPSFLRDWAYEFIAERRYRWFSKREVCRLPTALERERFLE